MGPKVALMDRPVPMVPTEAFPGQKERLGWTANSVKRVNRGSQEIPG